MTEKLIKMIDREIQEGFARYNQYHNSHEHYAVLQEEVDEWWDAIKGNTSHTHESLYELIQIAAVALRYVIERGNIDAIKEVQEARYHL